MKAGIIIIMAAFMFISAAIFSQTKLIHKKHIAVYTGMGVDYGITPDLNDFLIASIPYSTSDSIKSFNAGVAFFGGIEYDLSSNISASADYSYYIRSFDYTYSPAVFDYTIINHMPYLNIKYTYRSLKSNLKISAGMGYHFQKFDNKINNSTTLSYSSSGPSFRAEVTFLPKFSEDFMVYISGSGFINMYGKLKDDNDHTLKAQNSDTEASLKGYGVGARLGILFNIK